MKISREAIRDGVWLAGLGCTAAGSWIIGGPGVALLVAGVVLLGAGFASAVVGRVRGNPEP